MTGDIPKANKIDLTSFERTLKRNPLQNSRIKGEIWQEYNTLSMLCDDAPDAFRVHRASKAQVTDL